MKKAAFSMAGILLFVACGSDEEPSRAVCEQIVEACHPLDTGSGPIHECHESAEGTWTPEQCSAEKAHCLEVCVAGDAGTD
jgi:hypothetical protein